MVASDRISAFDFVLETTIPDKGEILTRMSLWWFDQLADLVPNHVRSTDVPPEVAGRAVVCKDLAMYPVECVARGYLTGSGLLDYQATGEVCGIALPHGLEDGSRLPSPIFTPASKAAIGDHDENISFARVVGDVGETEAASCATDPGGLRPCGGHRPGAGIQLADTKFEFGARLDTATRGRGTTVLADEVLTPDSSRYWPAEGWEPGHPQTSYDKQIVRNWLTSEESGWNRARRPAPACPPRSSSAPAAATSRPTSCSPGSGSEVDSDSMKLGGPVAFDVPVDEAFDYLSTRATGRSGSRRCAAWRSSTTVRHGSASGGGTTRSPGWSHRWRSRCWNRARSGSRRALACDPGDLSGVRPARPDAGSRCVRGPGPRPPRPAGWIATGAGARRSAPT